ncbi:GNAT family acetyltransferase [Alkalihalobacillus alcalophilus ATCC 27647 = CGMCC 1.3604]|uniref:Acetyltransferase n=1 Tax=Alkalihalobacillus alcalophilus ATCC 27647 = CGMCC 1.3604 TaxID=1218173 RepID=A0A094WDN9_ALKAL|nr:GNAT family N-acetyltransferase [Alkalihalobacillus alcalophilus]KGA95864.1 acetyltransferase [Alkalihalobacillus alcalophilus ATCC 27647 = CGMCC 1.3604]MED1563967.1 GNAT family N-acetyltransferase [Alkalihalobacillus alcalophilus]THG92100.1 GNAT family acetyltransferase [Alkalihalobacillus alcalophilus ATCC 27647 = CGMCC 1.3604]
MNIRILNEMDAQLYQELRLKALLINPEEFGSTYEREKEFKIELIEKRLKPTEDKFVLGAFDKNLLVSIVSFVRESNFKTVHKGNVFGMFVLPEKRGQGIGKAILLELIKVAKNVTGLEQINLTVVSENRAAKSLYKTIGFEVYGVERNALKFKEQYFDEELMVLYI